RVTEDDIVDASGLDTGSLDARTHDESGEIIGTDAGERAARTAERRPHRVIDVSRGHEIPSERDTLGRRMRRLARRRRHAMTAYPDGRGRGPVRLAFPQRQNSAVPPTSTGSVIGIDRLSNRRAGP